MFESALIGNVNIMKNIYNYFPNCNLNKFDDNGDTPLFIAATKNQHVCFFL